ncbi:MAG: polysaccharide deacetylase family protein [Bacteroidota bacterium]|nr:polysaccharide deacetylase family protein [Bacteroidota bacterium]
MPATEKALYLTFDDGPVPGPTDFALEVLARNNIKATFFCIGDNIRKHPALFARVVAAGHAIGNHTVNHVNGWKASSESYIANAGAFDTIAVEAGFHHPVKFFRPPYGRITRRQINLLKDYSIVMWDVLSGDYNQTLSAEDCLHRTIKACRPGSIIVFHDSYKAQRNMEYALPRLIDHFRSQGFVFLKLPENSIQSTGRL